VQITAIALGGLDSAQDGFDQAARRVSGAGLTADTAETKLLGCRFAGTEAGRRGQI